MKTTVGALVLATLAVFVTAETYPHTKVFGSPNFHTTPEMDNVAIGGIAAGYAVFGSLLLFAWIRIWIDEFERHRDYNRDLKEDITEMRRLGCDIAKIDAEYERMISKKGKHEEGMDLVAAAAEE